MILKNQLLQSTISLNAWYTLCLMFLLVVALQPLITNAELRGSEACQNQCFNRSECSEVGNGFCCQWDDIVDECVTRIGQEICPGTATMPPAPSTPIACPVTVTTLTKSTPRNLSDDIETESAPSTAPTDYYERLPTYHCEKNEKTPLDWQLCQGLSIDQITNLIINYKISSALSIMGSIYVIQDVLWDPKKRKESTYHRIMVGLSCSDIIFSFFGPFLGSWVMPTGSQIFAAGSDIACAVAGFFMTMAVPCTPLYNCSLATFYLL